MYSLARALNAGEFKYDEIPAIRATITTVARPKNRIMRRLFKNLNSAPSTNGFEPDVYFVLQMFLKNVGAYLVRDLLKRWSRIQVPFRGGRQKYVVVVLADIFIGDTNVLPESQIEILPHTKTQADCFADLL